MLMVGRILWTIKTHKKEGDIAPWIIHSTSGGPLASLSTFVHRILTNKLNKIDCLIMNTNELLQILGAINEMGDETRMVKMDVKNFYMSGGHKELKENSIEILEKGNLKEWCGDTIELLLSHQYVALELEELEVKQVQVGSGMGAVHSGSISDACFYNLVERIRLDTKKGRGARGVLLYARFRDAILAIVKGVDNLRKLVAEMRLNAKSCYEIEVEQVSKE